MLLKADLICTGYYAILFVSSRSNGVSRYYSGAPKHGFFRSVKPTTAEKARAQPATSVPATAAPTKKAKNTKDKFAATVLRRRSLHSVHWA
jgi:hypothetical protein